MLSTCGRDAEWVSIVSAWLCLWAHRYSRLDFALENSTPLVVSRKPPRLADAPSMAACLDTIGSAICISCDTNSPSIRIKPKVLSYPWNRRSNSARSFSKAPSSAYTSRQPLKAPSMSSTIFSASSVSKPKGRVSLKTFSRLEI